MRGIKITQSITNRDDISIDIYLKDINRRKLITREEEIELGKKIAEGDTIAFDKLVSANLRFVVTVAKQYQNKGLPLVDLIQAGNFGLIEAAKKWDYTKGFKFISYAVWWIRQAILLSISDQSRTIRVPMNQITAMNKINEAKRKLEQELGREPSLEEIELETGIDTSKINIAISSMNRSLSLDTPFKDEEVGTLLDIIPNKNAEYADSTLVTYSHNDILDSILNNFSNRERDIIRMFFGLGISPMSLEEIAARFGLGSERIRQIKDSVISTLKTKYSDELKQLL